jgi:alkanesulfonate monooxygenase SsuD/methylene tetrahydromethanopterin reductase-like flavin-dependent oxidoreductase (luciferase family)
VRYAVNLPNGGEEPYGDPIALAELAVEAEAAGWDGFFLWDHILLDASGPPVVDPWIALAAAAVRTQRIALGPVVTALPRRRPWKVAREAVSLDRLSQGRAVLGVGLGSPAEVELEPFGEEVDLRVRAAMLDEALAIVDGLWTGRPFSFAGEHYRLAEVTFQPPPVQRPRIPVWVGATWPHRRPFRRAARWDAVVPERQGAAGPTPAELAEIVAFMRDEGAFEHPFDVVVAGETDAERRDEAVAAVAEYERAGATWWSERLTPQRGSWEAIRARVQAGPPR